MFSFYFYFKGQMQQIKSFKINAKLKKFLQYVSVKTYLMRTYKKSY